MSIDAPRFMTDNLAADGVFSGTGIKTLAFVGALAATEEAGFRDWRSLAGISAGAITAMALAVGYDAQRLRESLERFDFEPIAEYGNPLLPLCELSPWESRRGDALTGWICTILEESPLAGVDATTTFGQLSVLAPRSTLVVVGTDIAHARAVEFPRDVPLYQDEHGEQLTPDAFPIHLAVRISAGFPYYFPPVGGLWDRSTKKQGVFVDGGLIGSLPISVFDRPRPSHPTWGFQIHSGFDARENEPSHREICEGAGAGVMFEGILETAMCSLDKFELRRSESRMIPIPTGEVPALNFLLSRAERDYLYQSGFKAAKEFFIGSPQPENSYGRVPGEQQQPSKWGVDFSSS
jgi:NTE family protein